MKIELSMPRQYWRRVRKAVSGRRTERGGVVDITQWCREVVSSFEAMEYHEGAVHPESRELSLAVFVVRALGNNNEPDTQAVIDAIMTRRDRGRQ